MISRLKDLLRRLLITFVKRRVAGDCTAKGRVIYVANHRSFLDGLVLSLLLPGSPLAVVNPEQVKSRWRKTLYRAVPHAIIDVRQPAALRALAKLGGDSVILFPEATHGDSFAARKVYEVPALFTMQCGAAIVPVHIGRRAIRISPSISLEKPAGASGKERRRQAVLRVRAIMENSIAASAPVVTIFEAFVDAVVSSGRRVDIIEDMRDETPRSYGRLLKGSLALGRWLSRFTREGEIVGVLLPNLVMTAGAILGTNAASRTPAMLNYTAGAAGIKNACVAANVKCIVTSRKFLAAIKASALPDSLPEFDWRFLEDFALALPDKLWLVCYALWFPRRSVKNKDGAKPAVVLFTSGSEDRPKGVALSHKALLANIWQMRALVDFDRHDKFFSSLPLYHSYGFTACMLMPLLSGTPIFLYPTPLHYRAIPEGFYRKGCTCLFGTATFLARYAEHANAHEFARIRYVIAGGEKLKPEVQDLWMEKFGVRILEGYGATECAPVIALNVPHRFKKNTVGHLLPGVEHRLTPVPGINAGALMHVRGPNLMLGYYRFERPGELLPPQSELGMGWYCTGDVVTIDRDGFAAIVGRVRRFAKIAGEMVSLEVVESIAARASPQHQHAAIARADSERGEAIVLFTTDIHLDRMALHHAALDAGLPALALARKIVYIRDIPLLGTGKTDYVELARRPIDTSAAVQRAL